MHTQSTAEYMHPVRISSMFLKHTPVMFWICIQYVLVNYYTIAFEYRNPKLPLAYSNEESNALEN